MLHVMHLLNTVPGAVSQGSGETAVIKSVANAAQETFVNKETEHALMAVK
jgi:hypothetical protein